MFRRLIDLGRDRHVMKSGFLCNTYLDVSGTDRVPPVEEEIAGAVGGEEPTADHGDAELDKA